MPTLDSHSSFMAGYIIYPIPCCLLAMWHENSSIARWDLGGLWNCLDQMNMTEWYSMTSEAGLLKVGQLPVGSLPLGTCAVGVLSWPIRNLTTLKPPGWRTMWQGHTKTVKSPEVPKDSSLWRFMSSLLDCLSFEMTLELTTIWRQPHGHCHVTATYISNP